MRYPLTRGSVHDGSDPPRTMWTMALDWDDVETLIGDPPAFFADQYPAMKFGEPLENYVFTFTDAAGAGGRGALAAEGMDDTHVIALRVKNWAQGELSPEPILLSQPTDEGMGMSAKAGQSEPQHGEGGAEMEPMESVPVVIQLRPDDGLATIHFHLAHEVEHDPARKARQIYLMMRYPMSLAVALREQIGKRHYYTVADGVERTPDERPVALVATGVGASFAESNKVTKLAKSCTMAQATFADMNGVLNLTLRAIICRNYPTP